MVFNTQIVSIIQCCFASFFEIPNWIQIVYFVMFFSTGKDVIKITYQDKIRLTALWKQASAGKYDPSKIPQVGYFDVVGNDRK